MISEKAERPLLPETVAIVGGGAAGFFAAITCAERRPDLRVVVLERSPRFLSKVLVSGGGRCNVTHACFEPRALSKGYPRGARALLGPFHRFQPRNTVEWFEARGVPLKAEADGRMFPVSDSSQTIVDCLFQAARAAGVELRAGTGVQRVQRLDPQNAPARMHVHSPPPRFELELSSGEKLLAQRVLIATGGVHCGHQWASELGHSVTPPVPSLFTFALSDPRIEGLAGVSVEQARVTLPTLKLEQLGPLLITHWGLSGPAVLKLSAWGARGLYDAAYHLPLELSFAPHLHEDSARDLLRDTREAQLKRTISKYSPLPIPQRLWARLTLAAGIADDLRWGECTRQQLHLLVQELIRGRYQITGKGVFKEEFVTCGGVALGEIDFRRMESKRCPGLHFAGEVLDIDGITGGYNFQAAWTTGWLAGNSMATEDG